MATTSRGIQYPTTASQVTPLANVFASLATTTNTALNSLESTVSEGANFYTGTEADRSAMTSPTVHNGIFFYATDSNILWVRRSGSWKRTAAGRPVLCNVVKNVAQNSSTSQHIISWNNSSAQYETDSMYSSSQNTRITIPFPGVWNVGFVLKSSGTVSITAGIRVNGTTYETELESADQGAPGAGTTVMVDGYRNLSAGDYIEVRATAASSGVSYNVSASRFYAKYEGQL